MTDETTIQASEEEDFDKAFEEFSAESDGDELEAEPEEAAEPAAEPEPPGDDVMAKLRQLEAERDDWRHRYQSNNGRMAVMQNKIDELTRAQQARQDVTRPPQSPDDSLSWKEFKEEYPDLANVWDAEMARRERAMLETVKQQLAPVNTTMQQLNAQQRERMLDEQTKLLEARHPDWRDIRNEPEFATYVNQQPPGIRSLADSEDAGEVAFLLTMYKNDVKKPADKSSQVSEIKAKRQQQLRQTEALPTTASQQGTESVAKDDFDGAFEAFSKRRDMMTRGRDRR